MRQRVLSTLLLIFLLASACTKPESKAQTPSEPKLSSSQAQPTLPEPEPEIPELDSQQILQFYGEIQAFLTEDSLNPPNGERILFTGSSSIRKWYSLAEDMHPLPVLNRGFGGAIIPQVNHFADRYILPHRPKLIVFYCGENDIANDRDPGSYPAESFQIFEKYIHYHLPETHILYIAMKPSPARWKYWAKFEEGNDLIRSFCQQDPRLEYIDVVPIMTGAEGEPDPSIFVRDRLHLNKEGYRRWTELIKPIVESHWADLQSAH